MLLVSYWLAAKPMRDLVTSCTTRFYIRSNILHLVYEIPGSYKATWKNIHSNPLFESCHTLKCMFFHPYLTLMLVVLEYVWKDIHLTV